ncbi:hypothetical protein [Lysobacter enzymogenes]|uniref:hypothetical protein n=1 Tax=Lysobacter enzymogenes TaxID=69 RepID=UPI000942CE57|nr:hypothetical protein [Lysobacter enzymogenes]
MSQLNSRLFFYAFALLAIALYWSGLKGPFVFDDPLNLEPLDQWLSGQANALEIVFGNQSGMLGRPVSMASFWFSAATGGLRPFPFKFGNLLLHIACAALAWQVARRMLARDEKLAPHAEKIAVAVAALWLIHPINVSTVLYAVQRMAQLSAFFTLAALWVYLSARVRLENGETRAAALRLFLWFPLMLALGAFSKENAVVAPALCLVLEIAYFRNPSSRPALIKLFYAALLLLPAIAGTLLILRHPEHFLVGYEARDFTLVERLLSQSRALMQYIAQIFWPRGAVMGVYTDDFPISHGLLSPATTLASLLALAAISTAAIAFRRRAPSFFAGWFFYLVAQGVESTVLPLELYFEHRNYLPSIGLLVAVAGLKDLLPARWRFDRPAYRIALPAAFLIAAGGFSWVTWNQVQIWRSEDSLTRNAIAQHPHSQRAIISAASLAMKGGDFAQARALLKRYTDDPILSHRATGYISTIAASCWENKSGDPAELDRAAAHFAAPVRLQDSLSFRYLLEMVDQGTCGTRVDNARIAAAIDKILQMASRQDETSKPKWLLRIIAATAYTRSGDWIRAQEHARLAWNRAADPAVGGLLARIYIHNGHKQDAIRTLAEVEARVRGFERVAQGELEEIRGLIAKMPE